MNLVKEDEPGVVAEVVVSFLALAPKIWLPAAPGNPFNMSKGNGKGVVVVPLAPLGLAPACIGIWSCGVRHGAILVVWGKVTTCLGAIFTADCFFSSRGSGAGVSGGMWWASSSNSPSDLQKQHFKISHNADLVTD